jgi:hypothetical protein
MLIGSGGKDSLKGGASSDKCTGGGGTDTEKSCESAKGIP